MPAPANLVHEISTSTGTGNFTLSAQNGKQRFSTAFGTGVTADVFDYFISNQDAAEWERGTGHMSDANTLVRDTVIESTNANAAVNFSAGTKNVTNDVPAAKQVQFDANQNVSFNNYFANAASTVSAAGTTVLTAASARSQRLTGSTTQTFQLPNATTLALGPVFTFDNNSSGALTINNAGGVAQYTVPAGGYVTAIVTDISSSNGVWDFHPTPPATVTWGSGVTGLVMNSALTTTPSVSAGASGATSPAFIPQRGSATTGYGGDSTHLYGVISGATAFNATATAFSPGASDGAALGTTALPWSDGFFASGGVLNWANGNYTITHLSSELDFSGRAAFGGSSQVGLFTETPRIQALGTDGNGGSIAAISYQANGSGPNLVLLKSRAASIGTQTVVQSGDTVGNVSFGGSDGTNFIEAARIQVTVDATPGTNDMPGKLSFQTTADGASSPTERMTIDNAGVVSIGGVPVYTNIPQNSQSAAYTTVLADAQKHILHPAADNNARTFTIAANASVAYPIGTAITFVNEINVVTIAINTDTLTLAGAGTTGSRTLAANGIATALKITSTKWIISGTGLT